MVTSAIAATSALQPVASAISSTHSMWIGVKYQPELAQRQRRRDPAREQAGSRLSDVSRSEKIHALNL